MLKCKPGDLAFIIKEDSGCEDNLGTVVEVLSLHKNNEWNIKCSYKRLTCTERTFLTRRIFHSKAELNEIVVMYDDYLCPIKGDELSDSEELESPIKETINES